MTFGKAIGSHLLAVMQYGQVCGYWEFLELVRSKSMRTYNWWLGKKRRVRKKYTLFLSKYMSPKEVREWYKRRKVAKGARA